MKKNNTIKAIRGMNDLLPEESALWMKVEAICADLFRQYNYRQIRTPVVESTHLFARSIGADTDIVSKEMYTFEDRNGDSLTLRPEGTASCARAGIEHGLFYNQQQRIWYHGPMFRHERPQKGRYRQFFQFGVECYGWPDADIEAEVLSMTAQLFSKLGLNDTHLQINSLGDSDSRSAYRSALVNYLQKFESKLDADSQRRLQSNPLRILDSKNQEVQEILLSAPNIHDYLSEQSKAHFSQIVGYLEVLEIEFSINPKLVRGLDYYNDTVFEWVNESYGAQSTVCAGGRYDKMVEQLGGAPTACFGFGMGQERLIQMLQEQNADICQTVDIPDVFLVSVGDAARAQALCLQYKLTERDIRVQLHCGEASMKNQFKRADRSGASIAVVIGEQEASDKTAGIKLLKQHEDQQIIKQFDVLNVVTNRLESL